MANVRGETKIVIHKFDYVFESSDSKNIKSSSVGLKKTINNFLLNLWSNPQINIISEFFISQEIGKTNNIINLLRK